MAGAGKNSSGLVLADIPERVALRELVAALQSRRDQIAELDLELQSLGEQLSAFEGTYHARLAAESHELSRVEGLVRHLERWVELLGGRQAADLGSRGHRLDRRRARELARRRSRRVPPEPKPDDPDDPSGEATAAALEIAAEAIPSSADRLKAAYRALARRFHPDLARTEDERLRFSDTMSRINALYRAGDVDRLVALAEQAKGGEIDDPELPVEAQLGLLRERLSWFEAVLDNLKEERAALERSPTCELWRNVQQAEAAGRDLVEELRHDLQARVERSYANVRDAVRLLETRVAHYNRQNVGAPTLPVRRKSKSALERLFDPYADKHLVRLGLEQSNRASASPKARQLADWLEAEAAAQPHVLRLALFAYVADLSPFPLRGLETYADLQLRFDTLAAADAAPVTLERALVDADDLVEYGVRRATDKVAHLGLRFRSLLAREAVPAALGALPVRRAFKEVLSVLGEHGPCSGCHEQVFAVPLYRLRGLDDLRASVCPRCGHTQSSYWMPKGKDVQAVLNSAFVDFEIVSEWRFRLARGSIAMQLVPRHVDDMTVRDLKTRLFDDVFARNDITLARGQLLLVQGKAPVADKTPLAEMEDQGFTIRFGPQAKLSEAEALEMLRHRIRTRFKPTG